MAVASGRNEQYYWNILLLNYQPQCNIAADAKRVFITEKPRIETGWKRNVATGKYRNKKIHKSTPCMVLQWLALPQIRAECYSVSETHKNHNHYVCSNINGGFTWPLAWRFMQSFALKITDLLGFECHVSYRFACISPVENSAAIDDRFAIENSFLWLRVIFGLHD